MAERQEAALLGGYGLDSRVPELGVVGADHGVAPADHVVATVRRDAHDTAEREDGEAFGDDRYGIAGLQPQRLVDKFGRGEANRVLQRPAPPWA